MARYVYNHFILQRNNRTSNLVSICLYGHFYCIVGFVFTSVICAVIGFVISLVLLGRCNSSEHALYDGIVDQLREDRHSWVTLDWCIVPLFVALAIAMGLSPYGTSLWLWLPFLSAFPILLFIICHNTTKKLMQTALKNEDKKWTNLITEMIESADKECHCTVSLLGNCNYISCPKRMAITEIYSVLSIRDYFQRYIQDRRSLTEWFLFLFTLLGAAGSVLGATYDIWTNEWNLFFDMCKQMLTADNPILSVIYCIIHLKIHHFNTSFAIIMC